MTAVKFKIRRVLMLAEENKKQGTLFPDLEDMPLVVKMLKDAGLPAKDAWELWQSGFDGVETDRRPEIAGEDREATFLNYVREKVDLLKRKQASGKVENSTGFLLEAIRKNYANAEFAAAERQREVKADREAKASRERKLEKLRDEKIELERARREDVSVVCKEILSSSSELAEEAAKALMQQVSWFRTRYKPGQTTLENYLKVSGLWVEMDRYLEERHSDRFIAVQEKYDARLEDIDKKIEELIQKNV